MSRITLDNTIVNSQHDQAARVYLKSLMAGVRKAPLPECGRWNPVIAIAVDSFQTVADSPHRGEIIGHLLNSMIGSKQYPADLKELLSGLIPDAPTPEMSNGNKPTQDEQKTPSLQVLSNEVDVPPLPEDVALSPELSRGACPLRDEYVQYSELLSPEGYKEFHEGSFWTMLSTIAARRIYAEFSKPLYTPLYIILTARTSLYAKSVTADVMRDVLTAAGLDWLLGADRTTPQKLMSDMAGKYIPDDYKRLLPDEQEILKLRLAMSGQVGWINDEFGKFVKGMLRQSSVMSDFAELFLTFDNCPPKYRNATIARSSEPIRHPYLSMLGCMTFASVRDNAKAGAEFWGDGFWARFSFITPPPGTYIDAPFTRGRKPVPASLSTALHEWHKRLGVPVIDIVEALDEKGKPTGKYEKHLIQEGEETRINISDAAYDGWVRYRSALRDMIAKFSNEDLDGSYDRLPIKAIRVATLAASLQGCTEIELRHWALAQEVTESWRTSLHQMYAQVNTQQQAETMEDKVLATTLALLEKQQDVSARDVGRALHKDSRDVSTYLRTLAKEEILEEVKGRQALRYRKPQQGVQQ
jgi:Protein of unknown function (DUF3987)